MSTAKQRCACLLLLLLCADAAPADKLLPWQSWLERPDPAATKALPELIEKKWYSSGGKEGSLAISQDAGPWGSKYFQFTVKIDHNNKGRYPQGWPAFQWKAEPPMNMSGWDSIQYWIRVKSRLDKPFPIRFILHTAGKNVLNEVIPGVRRDEWTQMRHAIRTRPNIDQVTLLHFFICENEYAHRDEMTFEVGGFELCNLKKELSQLPAKTAAMGLWAGERADTSDRVVMLDQGTRTLPCLLVAETGAECALDPNDQLRLRLHEVFSGKRWQVEDKLGRSVAAKTVTRLDRALALPALPPGYYLVTVDVARDGKSLLGGRVGCDDLYIKTPDESMTYTVLSIRTGMCLWVRDLLFGDIMCRTRIALPHVYDPLNKETYADFIKLYAHATGKHTEGNETGDTGLVYAAEAFRKSGDMTRCKFAEWLLQDSLKHMVDKMQAPSGATITWANELADKGIGKGAGTRAFGSYDSNQIGEWITPFARAIIYYANVADDTAYARQLSRAAKKAADYIANHSLQDSNGIPNVVRHVRLAELPDGSVKQVTYHQEGRQCDVYLGRALSGLSYYAYAMQLLGEAVPKRYWEAMDNSVKWCAWKMKPNGWFDWQCEDVVEGGCHTFLGNIYVAEGLFGCYLADRQAGRTAQAAAAQQAAWKAYEYVTDHCYIRGRKFEYPLEFWVGPYVYWLFTEYQDAVGPNPRCQDWLDTLNHKWAVERGWKDFLQRGGPGLCGRTSTNGMLEVSILAYPAIKHMEQIGKPFRYPPWRK